MVFGALGLSTIPLAAFFLLVTIGALYDLTTFTIPNWISIAIAIAFVLFAFAQGASILAVLAHVGIGGVVFIAGALLFFLGMLGGGDVKLLAAAAIWAGPGLVGPLIITTMILGGVFAVMLLLGRLLPENIRNIHPVIAGCLSDRKRMPYGVAIAAAVWILFLAMPAGSGNLYVTEGFAASAGYWG